MIKVQPKNMLDWALIIFRTAWSTKDVGCTMDLTPWRSFVLTRFAILGKKRVLWANVGILHSPRKIKKLLNTSGESLRNPL